MVASVQSRLAARIVDAYGGAERWRNASAVDTRITMGGLLLKLKGHSESSLSNLRAHTEIGRPYVRVEPIDDDGNVGVLEGHDVRRETPDGQILEERREIRRLFPTKGRRWLHWDRLDALCFVAYTQWTYNALPALLWREDIEWNEVDDSTLEAHFEPELPTHSAVQQFHFEDFGRWTTRPRCSATGPRPRTWSRSTAKPTGSRGPRGGVSGHAGRTARPGRRRSR